MSFLFKESTRVAHNTPAAVILLLNHTCPEKSVKMVMACKTESSKDLRFLAKTSRVPVSICVSFYLISRYE